MFDTNISTSGISTAGDASLKEIAELQKSLEAGYETDMEGMQGGSALRIQSLDTTLKATVQSNRHFVLFNSLPKPRATAVLDEWTEQSSIGGFLGGTFNNQDGAAMETNGEYARQTGRVKYLSTYRKIPIVLQAQNNIVDATALETTNGAKQLLSDIEFSMFEGDSSITPLAFDGIKAQIASLGSADHIIDLAGGALSAIDAIAKSAETIWGFGNFGMATDIYIPPSVQTDLNAHLDPAFRVALDNTPNSIAVGTNVSAVQTSYGAIKTRNDVFIRDEKMKTPFEIRNPIYAAAAAANNFTPASVVPTAGSGGASSAFLASQAGNYYYFVTGVNQNGESVGLLSAQVAVAAGGQASLAITKSTSGLETGYVIYRSRLNGTNALTDLREMARVARNAGGNVTTYVDLNREIPGSTNAFVLNLNPSDQAIDWRQYLPMMKIPMAATNAPIIPWLQMICGYLRIAKRNQHTVIKNIVPLTSVWKPFA